MDVSAPHAAFTIAAYLVTAGTLTIFSLVILLRANRLRKRLDDQYSDEKENT